MAVTNNDIGLLNFMDLTTNIPGNFMTMERKPNLFEFHYAVKKIRCIMLDVLHYVSKRRLLLTYKCLQNHLTK